MSLNLVQFNRPKQNKTKKVQLVNEGVGRLFEAKQQTEKDINQTCIWVNTLAELKLQVRKAITLF